MHRFELVLTFRPHFAQAKIEGSPGEAVPESGTQTWIPHPVHGRREPARAAGARSNAPHSQGKATASPSRVPARATNSPDRSRPRLAQRRLQNPARDEASRRVWTFAPHIRQATIPIAASFAALRVAVTRESPGDGDARHLLARAAQIISRKGERRPGGLAAGAAAKDDLLALRGVDRGKPGEGVLARVQIGEGRPQDLAQYRTIPRRGGVVQPGHDRGLEDPGGPVGGLEAACQFMLGVLERVGDRLSRGRQDQLERVVREEDRGFGALLPVKEGGQIVDQLGDVRAARRIVLQLRGQVPELGEERDPLPRSQGVTGLSRQEVLVEEILQLGRKRPRDRSRFPDARRLFTDSRIALS
jgi:hypothetical protein